MKIFLILLIIFATISFAAFLIDSNYCHFWDTEIPWGVLDRENYIKTTAECKINGYVAIPGIALYFFVLGPLLSLFR